MILKQRDGLFLNSYLMRGEVVAAECPLMAVISTGRRNTLIKTQKMACMLLNLKET